MNLLCVLARTPAPGHGKSRLRRALGDAATDKLALAFAEDVLGWPADGHALLVAHTSAAFPLLVPSGTALVAQEDGDLGRRISSAVDAGFALGASRVVIVGTDCPTLPASLLRSAFDGLALSGAALVPALDGGWIALGVDRPLGAALAGVGWSSSSTAIETIEALRDDGRAPAVLSPWYDLDEVADLDHLDGDAEARSRAPRTAAVLAGLRAGAP